MEAVPPSVSVVTHVLEALERYGYEVERIVINPTFMLRPAGVAVVIRFGENVNGIGKAVVARLEVGIDVRGDLDTGGLHRWRITRSFPSQHPSVPVIHLDAVFTLNGDISAGFIRQEGKAGVAMIQSLIEDAKAALEDTPLVPHLPRIHGPVVHLQAKVAGAIAVGRSGLVRTRDGKQSVTLEARNARLGICDHIIGRILPDIMSIGAAIVARSRTPKRRNAVRATYLTESVST